MTYNFGELVNLVLRPLNEVELTAGTFGSTTGFHSSVKDYVNAAILDIYFEQDNEWPFGWTEPTFVTTIGVNAYSKDATLASLDWESFRLKKRTISITSLTQTAGVATATTSDNHGILVGDPIIVSGASPAGYNGETIQVATVPTPTTFTYPVDSTLTSPATGTIITFSPYAEKFLDLLSYDDYRKNHLKIDGNAVTPGSYGEPEFVVRKPDNNFILTPKPYREYTVEYEGFALATPLVDFTDVPIIPEAYKQVIVDKALHYAYMFRDNLEQANLANERYKDNHRQVRRLLIPIDTYARFE